MHEQKKADGNFTIRALLYYTSPDGDKRYYDLKSITRLSKGCVSTTQRRMKTPKGYSKVWIVKVKEKIIYNNPDYKLKDL